MGVLPVLASERSNGSAFERAIDLVHLARKTLADPSLEVEMLEAFGFTASMLMQRMQQAARSSICATAQALNSSARSIRAWRVAVAAEAVKVAAESGPIWSLRQLSIKLGTVVKEIRAAITEFLQTK